MLKVLGLNEVANTIVGDASLRGVSGGQKRRVTLGEMLMPPRSIRYMDAISNGLDAATAYDIVQALKYVTETVGLTTVVSLLQVFFLILCFTDSGFKKFMSIYVRTYVLFMWMYTLRK